MHFVRQGRLLPEPQHIVVVEIQMPAGKAIEDLLRLTIELEECKKERQVWCGPGICPFPQRSQRLWVVTVREELRPIDRRLVCISGIELNELREILREPKQIVRAPFVHV